MQTKLYAKVFLYNFLPIFLLGGGILAVYTGDPRQAGIAAAFYGLFFGMFMAAVMTPLHVRAVKKVPGWKPEDFLSLERERTFTMNLPFEQAFDMAGRFLLGQAGLVLTSNDRNNSFILARAHMSLNNFGMKVRMDFREEEGRTQVTLLVKPGIPLALIDQGETMQLASKIERGLSGTV